MPEADNNPRPVASQGLAARGVAAPEEKRGDEQVRQPLNEAQRRAAHLDKIKDEQPDECYERRGKELTSLYEVHLANVQEAHAEHPTPSLPFEEMEMEDQLRWNEKRTAVDSANRAYNRAVKAACAGHRDEDIHLAKLRADAKPAA